MRSREDPPVVDEGAAADVHAQEQDAHLPRPLAYLHQLPLHHLAGHVGLTTAPVKGL